MTARREDEGQDPSGGSKRKAIGTHLYGAAILLATAILWASAGPTTKYLFLLPAPPSAALLTTCISVVTALFLLVGVLGSLMDGKSLTASWKPDADDRQAGGDDAEAEALLHSNLHAAGISAGATGTHALTAARCAAQRHHRHQQQLGGRDQGDARFGATNGACSQALNPDEEAPRSSTGFQTCHRASSNGADHAATTPQHNPSPNPAAPDGSVDAPVDRGLGGIGAGHVPGPGPGSWRLDLLTAPARSLPAAGMELGVYNVMAAALGAWGMQRISATRAAFLAQTTSLITPLLVWLGGGAVSLVVWLACCCGALGGAMVALDNVHNAGGQQQEGAEAGAGDAGARKLLASAALLAAGSGGGSEPNGGLDARALLEGSGSSGGGGGGWPGWSLSSQSMGVLYALLSCVFWGLGTVRLGVHSARFQPLHLAAAAAVAYAGLSISWLLSETLASPSSGLADFLELGLLVRNHVTAALLLWAGLGPGALSSYLQVVGQQTVPPAQAQVLFSSTPLWSALFAQLLLPGEAMGPLAWAGGAVMLGASLLASLWQ